MNDNFVKRKNTRLENYDYSASGTYFITVCADNRRRIFSDIVVGAIHESPEIRLKPYGKIAENVIKSLAKRFDIKIDKYVIMPDHIHLLITVNNQDCLRAVREPPLQNRSLISKAIGFMKMNVSKEIHKINPQEKVWQRSFFDHIIRNEQDYKQVWEYIENNPLKQIRRTYYGD